MFAAASRRSSTKNTVKVGTEIDYTLSEYAMVRFTVLRRRRALKRGRYFLVARATDYAGRRSESKRVRFTIVNPR